jgi:uncharacterized protein (DUF952 family)
LCSTKAQSKFKTGMTKTVYKIAKAADWQHATSSGRFVGSADDIRDGFIHLSAKHQLRGTLEKHFSGESELVLIAIEAEVLGPSLKWEVSRGGDLFPHLYGELPTSKTLWQRTLSLEKSGVPRLDEAWFAC